MEDFPADWQRHARTLLGQTPFFAGIGAEVLEWGDGAARARLPYGPTLVGDPDTGVVHGGVVTALLDHMGGAAVMAGLDNPVPIARLDLGIDSLQPAAAGATMGQESHHSRGRTAGAPRSP